MAAAGAGGAVFSIPGVPQGLVDALYGTGPGAIYQYIQHVKQQPIQKFEEILRNCSKDSGKCITDLFKYFTNRVTKPSKDIQPLLRVEDEPSSLYLDGRKYPSNHLYIYHKSLQNIPSEAVTEDNMENNRGNNPPFTEEESFLPNHENNGMSPNKNTVSMIPRDRFFTVTPDYGRRRPQITIPRDIDEYFRLPNANKGDSHPIYMIVGFPDNGRHLSLLVLYNGFLYSCGIGVPTDRIPPDTEEQATTAGASGAAGGATAAGSAFASGSKPGMSGITAAGISTAFQHKIGLDFSRQLGFGSNALILSPDYLYKGPDSRIFHIGILTQEHVEKLKYIANNNLRDISFNFKHVSESEYKFIGFKFGLNKTFSLIPLFGKIIPASGEINCTTFILSIFGDEIRCNTELFGIKIPLISHVVPDPNYCEIKDLTKKIKKLNNLDISLEYRHLFDNLLENINKTKGAIQGNLYNSYVLAKIILNYVGLNENEAEPAGAAAGAGGAAPMNYEGGRRRRRRSKKITKRRRTKRRLRRS